MHFPHNEGWGTQSICSCVHLHIFFGEKSTQVLFPLLNWVVGSSPWWCCRGSLSNIRGINSQLDMWDTFFFLLLIPLAQSERQTWSLSPLKSKQAVNQQNWLGADLLWENRRRCQGAERTGERSHTLCSPTPHPRSWTDWQESACLPTDPR